MNNFSSIEAKEWRKMPACKVFVMWTVAVLTCLLAPTLALANPQIPTLPDLLKEAQQKGKIKVIFSLHTDSIPEEDLQQAIADLQDLVVAEMRSQDVSEVKRFWFIPAMAMKVDASALQKLASLPQVKNIRLDRLTPPALPVSVPLIGGSTLWSQGYSGQGQTVAILDTGVDSSHPFLKDKVVAEACYSQNLCPNDSGAYAGAGTTCTLSGCEHGTHVAGIVAGKGTNFSGVAKDANLISVQVFSDEGDGNIGSYTSDEILALQYVYSLYTTYSIAAVNMSLGSEDVYTDFCDSLEPQIKAAIDILRSVNIPTVIASGNSRSSTGISFPACISSAISVGNSSKQDLVASDSNSAYYLDLMAPGSGYYRDIKVPGICSSIPSSFSSGQTLCFNSTGGSYAYLSGTSMAAPHVAGSWAILKSKYAASNTAPSVDTILQNLRSTGNPIFDARNGLTKPRIDLDNVLDFNNFRTVDLASETLVQRLDGDLNYEQTGFSVANAGDVNDDGYQDVIVGAPDSSGYAIGSGRAYVVFGSSSTAPIDLANLGSQGFRIDAAAQYDNTGFSVAGAGDVNGDGRADVIVGAPGADNNGLTNSGSAYVIFGKSSTTNIDLANLGNAGFRIDGAGSNASLGQRVDGIGDMNRDGYQDVAVVSSANATYVVFGKSSTSTVSVADCPNDGSECSPNLYGFRIEGSARSVAGVGDVNGDGIPDLIVGVFADNNGRSQSGSAYVIFGKDTYTVIYLDGLDSSQGFRIDGAAAYDDAGYSVDGAGDVNGDGKQDVIVGSPMADSNGRTDSGSANLVFGTGSTDTVDLANLGSQGFRIDGAAASDTAGQSVAGAGDINGDGYQDVIVGAPNANYVGSGSTGTANVVFGKNSTTAVDLANLSDQGFRIDGSESGAFAGFSVADAGDVNGDGREDLIVGSMGQNYSGDGQSGMAYIIYNGVTPTLSYSPSSYSARKGIPFSTSSPLVQRTGKPSYTVSPTLPTGLTLNAASGVISGTAGAVQSSRTYTVTMTDLTGVVVTTQMKIRVY